MLGCVTSFFCCWSFFFSGLPPVSELHIRHSDETSLSALWTHASGSSSRNSYVIQLFQSNTSTVIQTRTLSRDMRECTFNVLTPGRLYDITVTTITQNIHSSATLKGRTCKVLLPFSKKDYSFNTKSDNRVYFLKVLVMSDGTDFLFFLLWTNCDKC